MREGGLENSSLSSPQHVFKFVAVTQDIPEWGDFGLWEWTIVAVVGESQRDSTRPFRGAVFDPGNHDFDGAAGRCSDLPGQANL
jgi:hypothetical protein